VCKAGKKDIIGSRRPVGGVPEEERPPLPVPTRMDVNHFCMFESSTLYVLDNLNSIAYGTCTSKQPTTASTTC
jgi:hypothetical protein